LRTLLSFRDRTPSDNPYVPSEVDKKSFVG
jgi:hypothetical protein